MWWLTWLVLLLVRCWFLAYWWGQLPYGLVVAIPETAALWFGTINAVACRKRHTSAASILVPVLYLVPIAAMPPAPPSSGTGLVFALVLAVTAWALWHLGVRFTFAATAWHSLCDTGPYRLVRHPQEAARLLWCVWLMAAWASYVNWQYVQRAYLVAIASVFVIICEEWDLGRYPEWREYAKRVKWWFIPGVV